MWLRWLERSPDKGKVKGSSPFTTTKLYGAVVELVKTLHCHCRDHGFEPRQLRQIICFIWLYILMVENIPHKNDCVSSSLTITTKLYGALVELVKTLHCHCRDHGFEPRKLRQIICFKWLCSSVG